MTRTLGRRFRPSLPTLASTDTFVSVDRRAAIAASFSRCSTSSAGAEALPFPNPGGKGCASGYRSSGRFCAPIDERSAPAIPIRLRTHPGRIGP